MAHGCGGAQICLRCKRVYLEEGSMGKEASTGEGCGWACQGGASG